MDSAVLRQFVLSKFSDCFQLFLNSIEENITVDFIVFFSFITYVSFAVHFVAGSLKKKIQKIKGMLFRKFVEISAFRHLNFLYVTHMRF